MVQVRWTLANPPMLVGDDFTNSRKAGIRARAWPLPLRHSAGISPDFPRLQSAHDGSAFAVNDQYGPVILPGSRGLRKCGNDCLGQRVRVEMSPPFRSNKRFVLRIR